MLIIGLCAYAETRLCSDGSGGAEELTPPRGSSTQLLLKIFSTRHNFFFVKVLFFSYLCYLHVYKWHLVQTGK